MMSGLALISFITSYFVFYALTGKVDTKPLKTSNSVVVKSSPEESPLEKTIIIGDGQGSPSPDPNAIVTPEPSGDDVKVAVATPTPLVRVTPTATAVIATPTPTAVATIAPTVRPTVVATPVKTAAPVVASVPKTKQTSFKVRVGSFDSKSDAERKAKELEGMGYDVAVLDEPEGSYVQLGAFKDQEKALALAEEVSQKGYSVIIRQLEE